MTDNTSLKIYTSLLSEMTEDQNFLNLFNKDVNGNSNQLSHVTLIKMLAGKIVPDFNFSKKISNAVRDYLGENDKKKFLEECLKLQKDGINQVDENGVILDKKKEKEISSQEPQKNMLKPKFGTNINHDTGIKIDIYQLSFGAAFKMIRENSGKTVIETADLLDRKPEEISAIENGILNFDHSFVKNLEWLFKLPSKEYKQLLSVYEKELRAKEEVLGTDKAITPNPESKINEADILAARIQSIISKKNS